MPRTWGGTRSWKGPRTWQPTKPIDFLARNQKQKAVYWGNPTKDGYGKFSYDDPVEIDCRWVDTTEIIMAANGEQIVCNAKVRVSQDLDKQGMLYLGYLQNLTESQLSDPTTVDGAYEIKRFDKIPSVRGNKFYRKAYL